MRQLETQEQASLEQEGAEAAVVTGHGFALRYRLPGSILAQGNGEGCCCSAAPQAGNCRFLGGILQQQENDDNGIFFWLE